MENDAAKSVKALGAPASCEVSPTNCTAKIRDKGSPGDVVEPPEEPAVEDPVLVPVLPHNAHSIRTQHTQREMRDRQTDRHKAERTNG